MEDELDGLQEDFQSFVATMSSLDDTWKFWSRFVLEDFLPYVSLFIAIRSGNWDLRMAAIKSMAADFTAFDHPIYQRLITNHICDVLHMPTELLNFFQQGGFSVSISGRALHSVGIDESHEMLINKHTKQAVVRPTKDYINRVAQYISYRMKSINHFKAQLFGEKEISDQKIFTKDPCDIKMEQNINKIMEKINDAQLLPLTTTERGLVNPFRNIKANSAQSHDLLNFHSIGIETFETRVNSVVLNNASTKAPIRKKSCKHLNHQQKYLMRSKLCKRR